ncbi:uncharacterized protein LODBEIA_P42390 [Lodderomyces beijingensis]|uniref:Formamidopyrimidine-DNA glycosylase catalytic domain-containing protein n=1 Tax=Lodderomyces beijingensis TaxID=1775926 RepID=A0ABP0ZPD1_9ASCO
MPEVSEVAHVCALLRRQTLGFRVVGASVPVDSLLWPSIKAASNAEDEAERIKTQLVGSSVISTGRHGKYFWLRLKPKDVDRTNVLLMHFGMTGMIKIRNVKSHLIFMENGGDKKLVEQEKMAANLQEEVAEPDTSWPPRFTKFELELLKDGVKLEVAFVDARRLGRARLVQDDKAQTDEGLLKLPPLNALGPDYSKAQHVAKTTKTPSSEAAAFEFGDPDPDHHGRPRLGVEAFSKLVLSRKKAIKTLLLDQALFAGVGNWVGDEVIFHAKLHPEEVISSKISHEEGDSIHPVIQNLYNSLIYVCEESVKVEGAVRKFPKHWLMRHRWGKARKRQGPSKTEEGHVLDHITVGGRTSCFAPEVQKFLKVGKPKPVAVKTETETTSKRKRLLSSHDDEDSKSQPCKPKKPTSSKRQKVDQASVSNGKDGEHKTVKTRTSARIKAMSRQQ